MYAGAVPPPPGAPNLARGTSSPCGAPTAVGPIIRQARCPAPKRRRLSGDHGRDLPEKILELKYSPFPGPAGMQLLWERSLRRLSFLDSRRSDGGLVSSPTAFAHALLVSSPTPSSMLVSSPLLPGSLRPCSPRLLPDGLGPGVEWKRERVLQRWFLPQSTPDPSRLPQKRLGHTAGAEHAGGRRTRRQLRRLCCAYVEHQASAVVRG